MQCPGQKEDWKCQKQPSWGVLRKKCSENIQQIYRRTPMSEVWTPLGGYFLNIAEMLKMASHINHRKIPPPIKTLRLMLFNQVFLLKLRNIMGKWKCPLDNCPPGIVAPGQFLLRIIDSLDRWPVDISHLGLFRLG